MHKDSITEHKRVLRMMIAQAEKEMGIAEAYPYASKLLAALESLARIERE